MFLLTNFLFHLSKTTRSFRLRYLASQTDNHDQLQQQTIGKNIHECDLDPVDHGARLFSFRKSVAPLVSFEL